MLQFHVGVGGGLALGTTGFGARTLSATSTVYNPVFRACSDASRPCHEEDIAEYLDCPTGSRGSNSRNPLGTTFVPGVYPCVYLGVMSAQ